MPVDGVPVLGSLVVYGMLGDRVTGDRRALRDALVELRGWHLATGHGRVVAAWDGAAGAHRVDWAAVAAVVAPVEVDGAVLLAVARDEQVTIGQLMVWLDVIEYRDQVAVARRAPSCYEAGRVRPEQGGWVAETGWGGTLTAHGRYRSVEVAENRARAVIEGWRDELRDVLAGTGHPLLVALAGCCWAPATIEVWASSGERWRTRLWEITDIATACGVQRATVDIWRHRGVLPAPHVSTPRPKWEPDTIIAWAAETGRSIDPTAIT